MRTYEFHPVAGIFPLLEGGEFEELVEDIRRLGLNNAIELHEDMVLDGRNRLRACEIADVEPLASRCGNRGGEPPSRM